MTLRRVQCVCLVVLLAGSIGCNSDDGTSPTVTTNSSVSFILNGAAYANTTVELRDNERGIWQTVSNGRLLGVLDALGTFSATATKRVVFTLSIPASGAGTHSWIDPKGAVLSVSGVFIDIHDAAQSTRSYQAVEGSTVVTSFGDIGGQVQGTFSGTMRATGDGSIITISNGVFSLTRLANQ